jgi:hypothetical protein
MPRCNCIIVTHKKPCPKPATFTCGKCGDHLCGGCARNHHPHTGNFKPILMKGEFVAQTAYRSWLTPKERLVQDFKEWLNLFRVLYQAVKRKARDVVREEWNATR